MGLPSWPSSETLRSAYRGAGFNPWSGNQTLQEATEAAFAATEDPACRNHDLMQPMNKYLKRSLFKITLEEALQLLVSTQLLLETFRTIVRLTCGKNSSQRF